LDGLFFFVTKPEKPQEDFWFARTAEGIDAHADPAA